MKFKMNLSPKHGILSHLGILSNSQRPFPCISVLTLSATRPMIGPLSDGRGRTNRLYFRTHRALTPYHDRRVTVMTVRANNRANARTLPTQKEAIEDSL
jgi:hypothetical protein